MKRLLIAIILSGLLLSGRAQEPQRPPEHLTMTLAWVADAGEPNQYVFVINNVVAYKTVAGLKRYLKNVPKGSTLTWDHGCCRIGSGPELSAPDELKKFEDFCESIGLKLVPSG